MHLNIILCFWTHLDSCSLLCTHFRDTRLTVTGPVQIRFLIKKTLKETKPSRYTFTMNLTSRHKQTMDLTKFGFTTSTRVFSHVMLQLGKPRLTGNFFIECMIISDFTFVNKCLYAYYISINLSLNKLLNDI